MKTIGLIGAVLIALGSPALSDEQDDPDARRAELMERLHELGSREGELAELARELEDNSFELIELEGALAPKVRRHIRQAIVVEQRPIIGVTIGNIDAEGDVPDGVSVLGVTPGGPAEEAGLRSGDRIVRFADVELSEASGKAANRRLVDAIRDVDVGEPVTVVVERDGKAREFVVTPRLAAARRIQIPRAPRPPAVAFEGDYDYVRLPAVERMLSAAQRQWDGIELVDVSPELGRYFGTERGLLVVRTSDGNGLPLEDGDVIHTIGGREPQSVSQAMRILRSYDSGESLEIEIMRDKRRRKLELIVPDDG